VRTHYGEGAAGAERKPGLESIPIRAAS
jgi:hypothetical protein